jgi:hypothetical protein
MEKEMEPRAEEQSWVIQKRWGKACDYCPVCNHLRMDPDFSGSKAPPANHDPEDCPFCKSKGGIYWEDEQRDLPKERALRIWKPL